MINEFRWPHEFLSNFYFWPVRYEGILYPTSEHAYQAAKTRDPNVRLRISLLPTPGASKKAGKALDLRSDWEDVKVMVMADILRLKFAPGSYMAFLLLSTGDEHLVEGNYWHDTFWGVCNGRGQNHLGKLLMQIRAELR